MTASAPRPTVPGPLNLLCSSRSHRLDGIVDRIGSGDAFAAGVLHGRLAGLGDQDTLELAAAAAVLKHSIPGDFNLATLADVERLAAADPRDIER